MTIAKTKKIVGIQPVLKVREYYKEKEGLFGLIRWEEIVKTETFGNRLNIFIPIMPEELYLNGKKIINY